MSSLPRFVTVSCPSFGNLTVRTRAEQWEAGKFPLLARMLMLTLGRPFVSIHQLPPPSFAVALLPQ